MTSRETMQRAKAVAAAQPQTGALKCSGQIFCGIFFDGTGNNEGVDYKKVQDNPSEQQHSNVVRLYHSYPQDVQRATDRYFSHYVPGVGTAFPSIGDAGGTLGTGMSWNGEPRLIWGLTRLFNTVSLYVSDQELIDETKSGNIANAVGGIGSMEFHRQHVFKSYWMAKLKEKLANRSRNFPAPEQINLSVFGFSRGAAEARAFVNWMYALCDEVDGGYQFAGIPLRVEFLGIFDTVASVGIAGGFTSGLLGVEGRQSWAKNNMQVHRGVESCLHIVAAHEVRATFPVDSVRIDDRYPPNVKEYVYPGAHSDVGGGYHPKAQGKTDALARIPGFEMYCAAMAAGVPFKALKDMPGKTARALVPSRAAIDAFSAYCKHARVSAGPVEQMMRDHMAQYFNYRYHGRRVSGSASAAAHYYDRRFFKRATADQEFLRDTQQYFIAILAAVSMTLEHYIKRRTSFDQYFGQPFQNDGSSLPTVLQNFGKIMLNRLGALDDRLDTGDTDKLAHHVHEKVAQWRTWLEDRQSPFLLDEDAPERDILSVVTTLVETPQHADVVSFFDEWVHDSIAGLAKDKVNEFLLNGIGIAKFRRVYFGDRGDALLRQAVEKQNAERKKIADAKRAQRRQWDLESREFQRTRW
ncbi:hypothetical protein ASD15_17430 [Massilia sp. Root351]|nr:hypothetical protein ASD15_17430 [Massilia sp. Root351]